MRLILFGPPGSGKGTQAALLNKQEGLAHLSTGNILRSAIAQGTKIGNEVREHIAAGKLVPDAIVWRIAKAALTALNFEDFVLDGYPRTIQQAIWLDEALSAFGSPPFVISIEVPIDDLVRRLSGRRMHRTNGQIYHLEFNPPPEEIRPEDLVQRPDDQPEAVRKRLEIYHRDTSPVKEHYRRLGMIAEVYGVGDVQEVAERIRAVIDQGSVDLRNAR